MKKSIPYKIKVICHISVKQAINPSVLRRVSCSASPLTGTRRPSPCKAREVSGTGKNTYSFPIALSSWRKQKGPATKLCISLIQFPLPALPTLGWVLLLLLLGRRHLFYANFFIQMAGVCLACQGQWAMRLICRNCCGHPLHHGPWTVHQWQLPPTTQAGWCWTWHLCHKVLCCKPWWWMLEGLGDPGNTHPRKNNSCQTNLISFYERATSSVDQGDAVGIIHLDFNKAFVYKTSWKTCW